MDKSILSILLGITLLLNGCAPDQTEFQNSAAKLVKVDMPVKDAVKNLSDAGFSCEKHVYSNDTTGICYGKPSACIRVECGHTTVGLLMTCVKMVKFNTTNDDTVHFIEKSSINCFGGFG